MHPNHKMSSGERAVAAFLSAAGIRWLFESPVFVTDDNGRPRIWCPDFFLTDLGMHIEVMGPKGNYPYRETVYDANCLLVLFIDPYRNADWQRSLTDQLCCVQHYRSCLVLGLMRKDAA
ncbi:MAG: hypothetical protein JST82_01330 [Bacteroidetes bacterium]|nr:hypothetical protein [Bacteroidota bacterium]